MKKKPWIRWYKVGVWSELLSGAQPEIHTEPLRLAIPEDQNQLDPLEEENLKPTPSDTAVIIVNILPLGLRFSRKVLCFSMSSSFFFLSDCAHRKEPRSCVLKPGPSSDDWTLLATWITWFFWRKSFFFLLIELLLFSRGHYLKALKGKKNSTVDSPGRATTSY